MKISGRDVVDATEPIQVTINKRDITLGKKKNAHGCAAAIALCREHHADEAVVHFSRAYVRRGNTWYRYRVPQMLRSEVVAFDRGGEFQPGDYLLKAIEPAHKLNSRKRRNSSKGGSTPKTGNRPRGPYHVVSGTRGRMTVEEV